jgi:leucyl aminopeptidase (aminopeptidase T)
MTYFEKENTLNMDKYNEIINKFHTTYKTLSEPSDSVSKWINHFMAWSDMLIKLEGKLTEDYFKTQSVEVLKAENSKLYEEVLVENYGESYLNPVYMEGVFGKEIGQRLSYIGGQLRRFISYAYKHQTYRLSIGLSLLLATLNLYEKGDWSVEGLQRIIEKYNMDMMDINSHIVMNENYNGDTSFYTDIVQKDNLEDLRYLFKFGRYITDNELETAKFMNAYDRGELDILSRAVAKAYVEGFKRDGKEVSLRHNVRFVANVGQEQITKGIIEHLKTYNLNGFVQDVVSTDFNKQYDYDHKFDIGLLLTKEWVEKKLKSLATTANEHKEVLSDYSGIMYIERFGEEPFSPKANDARIKLGDDQQKFYQELQNEQRQLIEKHIPEQERSFCIVAFPTPEIGDQFEAIFEDTLKINMLDSDFYEGIQGKIIDALDLGQRVHVKGRGKNLTDIVVALQTLKNPEKETNFVNCVADVNIPVGEVFTSPVLKGTNGLLHIENVYLEGFNFENLKLWFKDGYIDSYECTNFDDTEKGKEFIRENLLFPHKSLPIGEFAIGTNTLAYVIAEKYGIVDKLPILIVEKMGPHFAIGDTCFSWAEDMPVYNQLDGKEIIARDNEHSIQRKEDVSKAYTNCHTDITIPYDALGFIAVLNEVGEKTEIIRDGRFVLAGTEALNEAFDKK